MGKLLQKNKAILDLSLTILSLLVAASLGIMAITVSLAANRIAEAQLQVAERQAVATEIQLQPHFRFELEPANDVFLELPHALRIFNDAAPIENVTVRQITFLELNRLLGPYGMNSENRWLPMYYFGDRHYTKQTTGLLCTLSSQWGPMQFDTEEDSAVSVPQLVNELEAAGVKLHTYRVRIFLELSYKDQAGGPHSVLYDINPPWSLHNQWASRRVDEDLAHSIRMCICLPAAPISRAASVPVPASGLGGWP